MPAPGPCDAIAVLVQHDTARNDAAPTQRALEFVADGMIISCVLSKYTTFICIGLEIVSRSSVRAVEGTVVLLAHSS
jgi:hypothetical protein